LEREDDDAVEDVDVVGDVDEVRARQVTAAHQDEAIDPPSCHELSNFAIPSLVFGVGESGPVPGVLLADACPAQITVPNTRRMGNHGSCCLSHTNLPTATWIAVPKRYRRHVAPSTSRQRLVGWRAGAGILSGDRSQR